MVFYSYEMPYQCNKNVQSCQKSWSERSDDHNFWQLCTMNYRRISRYTCIRERKYIYNASPRISRIKGMRALMVEGCFRFLPTTRLPSQRRKCQTNFPLQCRNPEGEEGGKEGKDRNRQSLWRLGTRKPKKRETGCIGFMSQFYFIDLFRQAGLFSDGCFAFVVSNCIKGHTKNMLRTLRRKDWRILRHERLTQTFRYLAACSRLGTRSKNILKLISSARHFYSSGAHATHHVAT